MGQKENKWGYQHPLEKHNRLIKERGVVVFRDVTSVPIYGVPYISPHAVIGINHQGMLRAEYDLNPIEFHPREISVIYPDHILKTHETSDDYNATLVAVSREFLMKLQHRSIYKYQLEYMKEPAFQLNDKQYEAVCHLIGMLEAICDMESPANEGMLLDTLDILSQMLDVYRFSNKPMLKERPRSEQLFYRFYNDLVEFHKQSHEVKFYAQRLNLSAKYFASIIKQETGVSVTEWISNFIVMQAQSLLQQRNYSIQQISDRLGFPEQSAFSRHFKQRTGLTPSYYRKKM